MNDKDEFNNNPSIDNKNEIKKKQETKSLNGSINTENDEVMTILSDQKDLNDQLSNQNTDFKVRKKINEKLISTICFLIIIVIVFTNDLIYQP